MASGAYSTGTILLTNASTAVVGTGTQFVGNVAAGHLLVTSAGVVYPIAAVVSATQLTLGRAFTGTTGGGQSYEIVPTGGTSVALTNAVGTLIAAFQAIVDEAGAGKFTDGTLSAPGMRFTQDEDTGLRRRASNSLALVAGGADVLGLTSAGVANGSAVMANDADTTAGKLVALTSTAGFAGFGMNGATQTLRTASNFDTLRTSGLWRASGNETGSPFGASAGVVLHLTRIAGDGVGRHMQLAFGITDGALRWRVLGASAWGTWFDIWNGGNTTVDSNGFIKEASPIVRLFARGTEEPVEPVGAVFKRKAAGSYELRQVEPLATRGWQIEVPQDANGNRLVYVETSYLPKSRVLHVTTSAPVWSQERGVWTPGEPIDIPEGRWVDLRFAPAELPG